MGLAVVRCPACRGASRVDPMALGLLVHCPHCAHTFAAVEEAEEVAPAWPRPDRNPTLPPPEPPRPRSRRRHRERDYDRPPATEPVPEPAHDPAHDPHAAPTGPLPASVLIGLALLPFAIPVLWLIAPVVLGEAPVLSVATPVALAVSASVLCLAVIYTIDWTPSTRVKGVLMLVCLAYFAAISLYFLKKEMVDRIQKATGLGEAAEWRLFRANPGGYEVKMPGKPVKGQQDQPCPTVATLALWQSTHRMPFVGNYEFIIGASPQLRPVRVKADGPAPGTDEWFDRLADEIVKHSNGGTLHQSLPVKHQEVFPGRQLEIRFGEGRPVRFVQVFFIKDRVFYLSAEGLGLHPDDDPASEFFGSFLVPGVRD